MVHKKTLYQMKRRFLVMRNATVKWFNAQKRLWFSYRFRNKGRRILPLFTASDGWLQGFK